MRRKVDFDIKKLMYRASRKLRKVFAFGIMCGMFSKL